MLGRFLASGSRLGLLAGTAITAVDLCVAGTGFLPGHGTDFAVYVLALLIALGSAVGAISGAWLWVASRLAARVRWDTGSRWLFALVASSPGIAFLWWVPTGWVTRNWDGLTGTYRAAAAGVYALLLVAAIVAARLTLAIVARYRHHAPGLPRLHWPLLSLAPIIAAACYWADVKLYSGLYDDFHAALIAAFTVFVTGTVALLRVTFARFVDLSHSTRLRLTQAAAAVWIISAALLVIAEATSRSTFGASQARAFPKVVAIGRSLTDFDADGTSSLFGGGDCAPFDGARSPDAFDIPDNDVDEDCSGQDMKWPPELPPSPPPSVEPSQPNVLLITVDSLRADHVGVYGYERDITPHIDALAADGWRFVRASAQDTKTCESMPSLFTGLYPSNLLRDYTHPRVRGAKPYVYYLQHDVPVLTELLAERGYHTHGYPMVSLLRSFGLDRGFRDYSRTRAVGREAQQLLAKEPAEPFFLWLHFHGPHRPYDKKKGYDYGDSLIDRYDSEIAYTDAQIGGVLEALRTAGLEQKTIVALTADHGEAFGERGTFFHGGKPHRELTHVPLIVRIPGRKPGVFDEPVELVDFVPTICELIGFSVPCTEFDGQSLLATAAGRRSAAYRGAYSENYDRYDGVQRRALFTGNWRLIQDRLTNSVELYDVRADPNEERDVAYLHPDIWKPLQEQIVARSLRRVANVFRRYDATRNPLELARGLSSIRDEALLGLALDRLAMAPARKPIAPHVQNLLSRPGLSPLVVQKADELLRKNQL